MTLPMTPVEMFNELVRLGYARSGRVEPSRLREPTAYITVPTTLAFSTPPVPKLEPGPQGVRSNAKLGRSPKRNPKRKKRSGR